MLIRKALEEELAAKFSELAATSPAKDVEKSVRALLVSLFSRFDLATREELEVQRQVLARTREKLATLETRVAILEARLRGDRASD